MQFRYLFKKDTLSQDKKKDSPIETPARRIPYAPDGLYTKCVSCGHMILTEDLYHRQMVCPDCGHYMRVDAYTRVGMVLDAGTFEEWDTGIEEQNPCDYPDYGKKTQQLKYETGLDEAVVTGTGKIGGNQVVIGVCDTRFLMGSMGHVVGEKLTRAIEQATKRSLPVIFFTCSGGARMQEGMISLMQMAKTSAALKKHDEAGNLYISVLTDPTTGGVTASFAMLGDIILAEPGALIGFAGPRVIRQTIGQELPDGFQRSEFLLSHGFVDRIVTRDNLRKTLADLVRMHQPVNNTHMKEYEDYLAKIYERKIDAKMRKKELSHPDNGGEDAWQIVAHSREIGRPGTLSYIEKLTKKFYEFHGDRNFGDDGAIVGGIAMFGKQPVTVIGHQKGRSTKENVERNFGMPYPEGYRKALRLMKQAEKFHRPILMFVDTPGAYCGIGAEERGQGEAIARNLFELSDINTPVLSIVIGEGGSGGALALAVADEVWMMENSTYSVLSPEGFASILWKDSGKAREAAQAMKITAADLYQLGIIEQIIPEFPVLSVENMNRVMLNLKRKIADFLYQYQNMDSEERIDRRYHRFRRF